MPFRSPSRVRPHRTLDRRRRRQEPMSVIHVHTETPTPRILTWTLVCLIFSTLIITAACTNATSAAKPPAPPDVEVAQVVQQDIPIYGDWIGTLDGMVNA